MPRIPRASILFCFTFLLFSAPTLLAQAVGAIVGELHVIRGDFPGRVMIELQMRGAPIATQYCDEQGKFAFGPLTDNVYHIIIRDERYNPVDERAVLDTSMTSTVMVPINLMPRPPAAKQDDRKSTKGSNPFIVDTEEYRQRFPKKAVKEFDKGLESDRDNKHDDAIRHYEKALALAPDFYPAHNNLGSDYLNKSDYASAQAQFEQAIKLNQSDAQAHLNLANLFFQQRKFDVALNSVQEGLRRDPNSAFGKFLLGSIYERTGKSQDAETALHEALKLDPGLAKVHLELVNLYLSQQKNAAAEAELTAFLTQAPTDPLVPKARELLNKLQGAK